MVADRRDRLGRRVYPVHRLDKPTSGVLLFALSGDAARSLTGQFSRGEVEKRYLAVVRGYTDAEAVIDYPLREQQDRMSDALEDTRAALDLPHLDADLGSPEAMPDLDAATMERLRQLGYVE